MEAAATAGASAARVHDCPADSVIAHRSPSNGSSGHRSWADAVRKNIPVTPPMPIPGVAGATTPTKPGQRRAGSPVATPPHSPELASSAILLGAARSLDESPLGLAFQPRLPSISDEDADDDNEDGASSSGDDDTPMWRATGQSDSEDGSDSEDDEQPPSDDDGGFGAEGREQVNVALASLTIEDDAETAGAPGWLLQKLQQGTTRHTCKAGFLQMGMERCTSGTQKDGTELAVGATDINDELPPEGWETRTSRRDGRPYFFNAETGESRWPRQRRSSTNRELAAERCNACKTEWIAMHYGSQHRCAPTATEAIELAQQQLSADNAARRALAYQLLALSAASHHRLGASSIASLLPFDLHQMVGAVLNWHLVGAAAATRFQEQGWAWEATATFSLPGSFSLGSFATSVMPSLSLKNGRPAGGAGGGRLAQRAAGARASARRKAGRKARDGGVSER